MSYQFHYHIDLTKIKINSLVIVRKFKTSQNVEDIMERVKIVKLSTKLFEETKYRATQIMTKQESI